MAVSESVREQIETKTGASIVDIRPFDSGNNTSLFLADLQGGERLVAKIARSDTARLDLEGWMLTYLKRHSTLPVPEVIIASKTMLVMTYIPSAGVVDEKAQAHAAELLAALHSVRAERYGLDRDTLIGPLHQPNRQSESWLEFFRDQRLMFMARAAYEEKRINAALMQSIEKLAANLDRYITEPAPPSLLHGDVWGGNVLAAAGRINGFIDPAIYYGDPEIELAFTTMFGTFGDRFFERYNELFPLRDGFFEVRKDLYNLYPLLVHARLFGQSYAGSVGRAVDRLAA